MRGVCLKQRDESRESSTSSRDVPKETADIHGLKTLLENTSKHISVQPRSFNSVEYLIQLAQVAAGGAEALKKRPIISMWTTYSSVTIWLKGHGHGGSYSVLSCWSIDKL